MCVMVDISQMPQPNRVMNKMPGNADNNGYGNIKLYTIYSETRRKFETYNPMQSANLKT